MEKSDIDEFRQRLLRLKSELEAREEASRDATKPVMLDQASVGRLSRMDAMQGQQMALEEARRRQQQLLRIARALRRIEAGDFGYCSVCGTEIPSGRLLIDPAATRCVACAEA